MAALHKLIHYHPAMREALLNHQHSHFDQGILQRTKVRIPVMKCSQRLPPVQTDKKAACMVP